MVNSSSVTAPSSPPSDSSVWESIVNALKGNKGLATVLGSAAASVVGFVLYKVFSKNKSTEKLAVSIRTATEKPSTETSTPVTAEPEWILYNSEDASGVSSWKVCNQKKIGVSFKMPAQYEVEVHSQGPITTITLIDASNMNMMMGGGGGDATMITIEEVPSELDIKQYMKNSVSALAQTQVPFRVLEENDRVKVNGIEACHMISELTGQQKVKIFAIAFKNPEEPNKVFMFQHIGTDMKAFESNISRTKNIIRTVKLQKGELYGRVSYRNDKLGYILNLPSTDFLAIGSKTDRALYLENKNVETYMIHYSKEDNIDKEIVIITCDAQDLEKFVSEQKTIHSSKTGYMSLGQMKIGHNNGELIAYTDKANSYVASEKEKSEIQADYDFIEIYFQRGSTIYTILGRSLPQISEKFKVDFLTMVKKMKFFEDVNPTSGASLIYENTEFNFKISQPIKLQATAKENNSDNPVVTLLAQNDENSLPLETMVTIAEPNQMMPVSDLDGLSQLMKAELQMIQMYSGGSPANIERDGMTKLIDGTDAFSMIYSMVDPMSNESLVMHQTGLLLPSKKIANIKSYTYQQMYNDQVKSSFDSIHKSFCCKH